MLLSGRVAVVAGVGPGLGRDIALRLADHGADIAVGARNPQGLKALAAEVEARGRRAVWRATDVTSGGDCRALTTLAGKRLGRVDVVVFNAFRGSEVWTDIADADVDDWHRSMEVNFWGGLRMIQAALPALRSAGGGSIVVIGSMSQRVVSSRGRGIYAASKAALVQLARNLAYEVSGDGVRVNAVLPGWMAGPTVNAALARRAAETGVPVATQLADIVDQIPLGRMPSSAEVAGTVVFLASDLSACVTGQCLDANGGQYLHG
jgi:NAD(P)-dependent dehydrogenase (short-subunit alcohol dehydrogenase family)